MKATGIVRNLDNLGRIVIPIELRRTLSISTLDALEVFTQDDLIILRKYEAGQTCAVTGQVSDNNQTFADGKIVLSEEGIRQLKREFEGK